MSRPPGVRIFRAAGVDDLRYRGPRFVCTIRSRGRMGARRRLELMRMTPAQRAPLLEQWVKQAQQARRRGAQRALRGTGA